MSELSPDDIYEGLLCYGMFSDKIPPCFTSKSFYEYCVSKKGNFENREYKYVIYNSIRNINIPRQLGILSQWHMIIYASAFQITGETY